MQFRVVVALFAVSLLSIGCAKKTRVTKTPRIGAVETGVASWYGHPYHGRRAANGEVYDMEKMTAAHRTLPFNTWVRVRNLTNEKTTEVRITDRGPFIDGRIIDLSRAAAREIDMIGPGTARVEVAIISPPAGAPPADLFAVQTGAFRERSNAERLRDDMQSRFGRARLVERQAQTTIWRVLVGEESSAESAAALAARIEAAGFDAFVVRVD